MRWRRRHRDFEREMADELSSHLEHRADDLTAAGLERAEALRQARIELGSVETHKEAVRDERTFGRTRRFIEQSGRDLRFATRRLRKAPVFALFSIASIGVGAGVTTAMFSILYAVQWAPSGIRQADRVALLGNQLQDGVPNWDRALSLADYEDYRRDQHSFAALAAVAKTYQPVAVSASTELLQGEAVTGDYFDLLGVAALTGRTLQPVDDHPGASSVVVLSHQFWRSRLSGDPHVVGRSIRIGGLSFDIVGVAPREYRGLSRAATGVAASFWIPMSSLARTGAYESPLERPDDHTRLTLSAVGRLAPATSLTLANAEAVVLGKGLDQSYPLSTVVMTANGQQRYPGARSWLVRPIENLGGGRDALINRVGMALFAIIGLVLAVACTNLANLSLARGAARQQELAVRLALGASRGRLIRELVAESTLIGVVGFGLAMCVSLPVIASATYAPLFSGIPASIDPHLTGPAILVAALAVMLALLVCGLWPAVRLSHADVRSVIAAGGVSGTPPWRAQRTLIRWQVVVSVAFFCTAAVFISALSAQTAHDPGVDLDHLTVARTSFPLQQWDHARAIRAIDAVTSTSLASFGFRSVAATSSVPFGANVYVHALLAPADGSAVQRQSTLLMASTPGIFDALGIPIVQGRPFDQRDVMGSLAAVVISETSAKELFGTTNAIGRTVLMQGSINAIDQKTVETRTVIGVTRDTDTGSLLQGSRRMGVAFVPIAQHYEPTSFIIARGFGDAGAGSLRALINFADAEVAVESAGSGLSMLGGVWVAVRVVAGVSLAIGVLTLVLTMAGLSGVLAHVVLRRTREIGIRKALGADANAIVWLVVKDGARPVASGTAIGLGIGILGGFLVRAAIPISAVPVQPLAILIVALAVVPATLIACYLPARRAARVDPHLTLKDL